VLHLTWSVRILPVKQIFNQSAGVGVGHIYKCFHLLFELVFEKLVVNADNAFNVNVDDA
jgi:hypothetical protein